MADALHEEDQLPAALPYPISITVRNSDLGIDEAGKATRLDDTRMVATIQRQVNPGTVFFTSIDMRAMNMTARGLIRVVAQWPRDDGQGLEILADFIELSDDAKTKIARLLGRGAAPQPPPVPSRNFAMDQLGVQPVYQRGAAARSDLQVASSERSYFEPAPLRQHARPTGSTKFWSSLGVTAYVIAALIVVA